MQFPLISTFIGLPERSNTMPVAAAPQPKRGPVVRELAFLLYEQRDLHAARRFWTSLGLTVSEHTEHWLAMSSCEGEAYILVATKGKRSRFVGSAFLVDEESDLASLVQSGSATRVSKAIVPGGGEAVSFTDQSGQEVWLIKR